MEHDANIVIYDVPLIVLVCTPTLAPSRQNEMP
jgi:hypothetical protein